MGTFKERHEYVIHSYKSRMAPDPSISERNNEDFPLIDLLEAFPIMPAPHSSIDAGEGFMWQNFIICFQKEPVSLIEGLSGGAQQLPMKYPYSMTVIYHPEYTPHHPSTRSILALSLEQCTMALLHK